MKMGKIEWIVLTLIVLAIIGIAYGSLNAEIPAECETTCYTANTTIYPDGAVTCVSVFCARQPHPIFYISIGLLVITVVAYALYLAKKKFVK